MYYTANVTDTAYCYDGSFAGFCAACLRAIPAKEIPAEVCPPEEGQLNLFGTRDIPTDLQRPARGGGAGPAGLAGEKTALQPAFSAQSRARI